MLPEEGLQRLDGLVLVRTVNREFHRVPALDPHAHDGEEPLQVRLFLPTGQLDGTGILLGLLDQQACGPGVEAVRVVDSISHLFHGKFPRFLKIGCGMSCPPQVSPDGDTG